MNFELESVDCNLCGKSNTRLYATVSYIDYLNRRPELKSDDDPILKNEELASFKFSLVKCKNCNLIYTNPRLTEKSLAKLYQDEYFSYYADTKSEAHRKRQETFKVEIAELERLTDKRKILDVGCGGGFFLAAMDNSWDKYGVEINPAAVNYARDTFGLNIIKGNLKEASFSDEAFDVVIIRGVIEHLPDPAGVLYEINRILREDGIIAVKTPNISSICARIYKEKFRIADPIHHVYYFSTKSLSSMLKNVGFEVQKISYYYFNTPYASWKNTLKILIDVTTFRIFRKFDTISPPFYGNIANIYAVKEHKY